jgi:glycerol-3-phosphate O-acyltransferase/dihydroxyacetone phosphate acyltransferase
MDVVNRPVHFIAAAKSMRRPLVGQLLAAAGSIPVERQQDLPRVKGEGVVT